MKSYKGRRWLKSKWVKALIALILVGVLAFGALLGTVLHGSYDHVEGEPEIMVILGCQVKPWGPSVLLQDRLNKALDYALAAATSLGTVTILVFLLVAMT